jgi:phosphatidylglycerophosphate synthase
LAVTDATATERALIDARDPAAWQVVGGLSLIARLVRSLELAGVGEIRVLADRPVSPVELGARQPDTRLVCERLPRDAAPCLAPGADGEGPLLAVDGTLVVDRRLLSALADYEESAVVWPVPATETGAPRIRLARLGSRELGLFGAAEAGEGNVARLDPAELETYTLEMRGHHPILLLDASTPARAAEASERLVLETQKQVMDAPARWIDPFFENAILRRLAPTRVTPNAVSLGGTAIGLLAAIFLYWGWIWPAFPLMLLVGWLDGVDGKLARLRLHYTRFGSAESFLDFLYENAWWFALTAHLHGSYGDAALLAGGALILGNLLAEGMLTLGFAYLSNSLDLLSPFDRVFRIVAGRRNIFVWILILAGLAGSLWCGFVICGVWAMVTGLEHAARLIMKLGARSRRAD